MLLAINPASSANTPPPPPSDEDVWAYIVFLYGYDEEEFAELEQLGPKQKAAYIQHVRSATQLKAKHPDDFTPEERAYYEQTREAFRKDKRDMQAALSIGSSLNEEDAREIAKQAVKLIEQCKDEALTPRHILQYQRGHADSPIPESFAHLKPVKIRTFTNSLEIQLYVNEFKPDGPQVFIDVIPSKSEDTIKVRYSTNVSVGKSWLVDAPGTERSMKHGPR